MTIETAPKRTFSIQHMPNGRTRVSCSFIGTGESDILLEIVGDEDNPKTGRRWYDPVKESVEYIGRNWGPIVFILGIFFKTLMQA